MKFIRNIDLSKSKYKIDWQYIDLIEENNRKVKIYGLCESPRKKQPKITINLKQAQQEMIDTIIHEVIHASNWDLNEKRVSKTATDIANFLWKIGVRIENFYESNQQNKNMPNKKKKRKSKY